MQQPLSDEEEIQNQSDVEQNSDDEAFDVIVPITLDDTEHRIVYSVNVRGNRISVHDLDDNETEIGYIEISDDTLDQVIVDENYQHNGIGTRLIQLAIEHLRLEIIPCVQESDAYTFCLTPAGEALVASCIRNEIITEDMCVFSGDGRFLAEDASGDPGYDSLIVRNALGTNPRHQREDSDNENDDLENTDFYEYDPDTERRLIAESDELADSDGSQSSDDAPLPTFTNLLSLQDGTDPVDAPTPRSSFGRDSP